MAKWQPFPLPDGSYSDDTRAWSAQDGVNFLPVRAEMQGARSPVKHTPVPGMQRRAYLGSDPVRVGGLHDVEGKLYAVAGNSLYRIYPDWTTEELGTIPGTGPVRMVHNQVTGGNQLVIATSGATYVYAEEGVVPEGLVPVTDPGFPGAKWVGFIGQLIVYIEPMGRYFGWSALADAQSYNSLDVAQAETSPDSIVTGAVSNNELLIFGTNTIEPWAFSPSGNATFQLRTGSVIQSGCGAARSVVNLDNSVFYLTSNGQVARLDGYTPRIVSTMAIESDIKGRNWSRAFATTWEDKGHVVYYLTFPDGHTWGYDVRQDKWHRRESYGFDRWRVNALVKSGGKWIAGDFQSGYIYELEFGNVYEGCEIMPRKLRTGVQHDGSNRVSVDAFRLVAATGQPPMMPGAAPVQTPTFGSLLVTGAEPSEGAPMWAIATPSAELSFEGIPTAGGADLSSCYPAYYGGVWCVIGAAGEVRYYEGEALSVDASWETASSGMLYVPYSLTGGSDGWFAIDGDNNPSVKASLVPSGGFASYTFAQMDGVTNLGTAAAAYDVAYTGGKYYAGSDNASVVGLQSSSTLGASWDVLVNRTDDPGDPFSLGRDFRQFGDALYAIHHVALGGADRLGMSLDGGRTWSTVKDFSAIDPDLWPTQLETGNGVLLALTADSKYVWTSEDDFAEPHETGVYDRTPGAVGRHIAYSSGLFFIACGETEANTAVSNSVVTTADGLTFTPTEWTTVATLSGIAASADPDEVSIDPCTPMEGGFFQLRYSNDGAENWSNWRDAEAPRTGWFLQPLVWRRLGMARHRVWEILDTSNRPQDVLAAEIIAH